MCIPGSSEIMFKFWIFSKTTYFAGICKAKIKKKKYVYSRMSKNCNVQCVCRILFYRWKNSNAQSFYQKNWEKNTQNNTIDRGQIILGIYFANNIRNILKNLIYHINIPDVFPEHIQVEKSLFHFFWYLCKK